MRVYRLVMVGLMGASLAAGCGKSEEQKAAEQMADAAKQMANAATQTANQAAAQGMAAGAQAMAQGLQAMAQATQQTGPDGKPLPPVAYEKLKELIPEVSGWQRSTPSGEQTNMPFSMSTAEARYTKGQQSVKINVTDAVIARMFISPFLMFMNNYDQRSDSGYKRSTTVNGFPAYEEWNTSSKHGEVTTLVGNRFLVQTSGSNLTSIDDVKAIAGALDMAKLAGLK
jgi:hypothetical protein